MKNRRDGLHDDVFFIVRGNQDSNARRRVRHDGMVREQFLDESEQTDDYGASADEDDAENKNDADEETRPLKECENKSVGARFEALFGGEGRHHFRACFSEQIRNRNELVSLRAQRVDDLRQSRDGLRAIAAAVVQENDIALVRLPEDAVDNFLCGDGLAVAQAPVIRIDALADDEITHLLRHGKLHDLLRIFRLVINAVGRAEKDGFYTERAFNQALRQIQLPTDFRACTVVEPWMHEVMISNFADITRTEIRWQLNLTERLNIRLLVGHVADY